MIARVIDHEDGLEGGESYDHIEVSDWDGRPMICAGASAGYVTLATVGTDGVIRSVCFAGEEAGAVVRAIKAARGSGGRA